MKLKLKKGLKLNIAGAVREDSPATGVPTHIAAICPDDFPGFVPKTAVKEGDTVDLGAPLLYDKNHPTVKLVSPVSGKVKGIVRGERRKILRVEIEADGRSADKKAASEIKDKDAAVRFLAENGLLALMRQRPYDIVPNPDDTVRDIFITGLDTAPLAYPLDRLCEINFDKSDLEAGIELLSKVTAGKVYVSTASDWCFGPIKGAEMVTIEGPHPAGNVSVQIANIKPVDKGDIVWTLDIITLGRIGRTLRTGVFASSATVALTGPEAKNTCLLATTLGASLAPLIDGHINDDGRHHRVISGNVLTGVADKPEEAFLRYPYRQITIIAEGDDVDEFMGWASFSPKKMSESRSFPGHFIKRLFSPDARLNGGRRAMIMSGQYESTMPMDIMPEYLIKAILSHNVEDMEKLGIYEVAPEDFAAAEYVDTSKLPLQKIVRDGLDYLRKELE